MRHVRCLAVAMLTLVLAACSAGDSPTAPVDGADPSFTLAIAGDVTRSGSGLAAAFFHRSGFSESLQGGATRAVSDVTEIVLTLAGAGGPSTSIGLLGAAQTGRWTVRTREFLLGARPEFYGSHTVPRSDGGRDVYEFTLGAVRIDGISPYIAGTFEVYSARVFRWPANPTAGTTVTGEPAMLRLTGSFRARPPR